MRAFIVLLMLLISLVCLAMGCLIHIDPSMQIAGLPLLNTAHMSAHSVAMQGNACLISSVIMFMYSFIAAAFRH